MVKRSLILLILGLIQFGCGYKTDTLTPGELPDGTRNHWETEKRDFLKIEDVHIGDGPVAAWNRRIEATLDVRYTDGTVVFQGPTFYHDGFRTMPDGGIYDNRHLSGAQEGIRLGINGMAVGGTRRLIVDPHLTCAEARRDPSPKYSCDLVGPGNFGPRPRTKVRQETLIVEVKLTESCIPIKLKASIWPLFRYYGEIICQDQPTPHVDPSAPTWRLY